MADRMIRRQDAWPLGAIGFILAVTAGWWTLALWAAPAAPDWLERARYVCFNITDTGLPDTKGWLLLLGQPPTMLAALWVGWRDQVRSSLRHLVASPPGKAVATGTVALVLAGFGLAGVRVADARLPEVDWSGQGAAPSTYPRLDRAWPTLPALVDHSGGEFTLERLGGRAALVTFAFGHCATLCPAVIHQARAARAALDPELPIVVFTLDPWRDTPSRLGQLVQQYALDPAVDFVVGGSVAEVEAGLDQWGIARTRDPRTGDIVHPGLVYLVEPDGTLAYASTGGVEQLVSLGQRLQTSEPTT